MRSVWSKGNLVYKLEVILDYWDYSKELRRTKTRVEILNFVSISREPSKA